MRIDLAAVPVPPVFGWLAAAGGVAEAEMLRTFNCGIGMVAIVAAADADAVADVLTAEGETACRASARSVAVPPDGCRVAYSGRLDLRLTAWRAPRTAVLISGRGTNMAALIAAAAAPDYPAEIALVVVQPAGRRRARACAAEAGIATAVVESRPFGKDRAAFEAALQAELEAAGIELVCLAGFMRVLTPAFVERWQDRMLNIHPALLPAFPGLDTHERALAAGVKLHGCTVHLVVPRGRFGPILAQAAVPVLPGDTPDTLAARVLAQEHVIYPAALARLARGLAPGGADPAQALVVPAP